MHDIPHLCPDMAIVIYGLRPDGGNSLATITSMLESRSVSMTSATGNARHVMPSAVALKDESHWNTAGSLLVCSAYCANLFQPSSTLYRVSVCK